MTDLIVIAGFAKCGTTSLVDWLNLSALVHVPEKKELHYFSRKKLFSRKKIVLSEYKKYLPSSYSDYRAYFNDNKVNIDGSTSYSFYYSESIKEIIANFSSDTKVVFVVRNPIDGLISRYLHSFSRGWESRSINAIINDSASYGGEEYFEDDYLEVFKFKNALEAYSAAFKNMKVISFEDIINNSRSTKSELCKFINIPLIEEDIPHSNLTVMSNAFISKGYYLIKSLILKIGMKERTFLRLTGAIKKTFMKKAAKPLLSETEIAYLDNYYSEDIKYLKDKWDICFVE